MNEITRFFSIPVLKDAIIKHLQTESHIIENTLKSPSIIDCQVYCQAPTFQVSDGSIIFDCELTENALYSLEKIGKLIGTTDFKGMIVGLQKYEFRAKSKKRYYIWIDQLTVNKIDKTGIIGTPQPYYTDKSICDYVNLYQQFIEKNIISDYIDSLPGIDNIISGPNDKFPLYIALDQKNQNEQPASNIRTPTKFMDLTQDELKTLMTQPENTSKILMPPKAIQKRITPETDLSKYAAPPIKVERKRGRPKMKGLEKFMNWQKDQLNTDKPELQKSAGDKGIEFMEVENKKEEIEDFDALFEGGVKKAKKE